MRTSILKTIAAAAACLIAALPLMTSCSWAELPSYDEAEISAVQFYYRWAGSDKDAVTGEPIVREKRMETDFTVDSGQCLITAEVSVPEASGDFTEEVRAAVSQSRLWGQVTVSTAARITPVDGSASLGTPDDWTQERHFRVMAANGAIKNWTIRIVSFNR